MRPTYRNFLSRTLVVSGFLMVVLSATLPIQAQVLTASISASYYGYLDQYSMNTENSFVGDEACVPTSTTNGLTLLQNLNPSLFGTGLSGSTYEDWHATDNTLINDLGTTASSGTTYTHIPYGITDYLNSLPGNVTSQITMSGQFSTGGWDTRYPQPTYITAVDPTAQFIYTAIQGQDAVLLSIDYSTRNGTYTSGGHELLASGITWDTSTNTGTIYFVDPLDSSATFSSGASDGTAYDQANAPAMITTGTITLLGSGSGSPGSLLLEYDQYETTGITVPNTTPSQYQHVYATIDNVFALGAVPEPSEYLLLFIGLAGLILYRRFGGKLQR